MWFDCPYSHPIHLAFSRPFPTPPIVTLTRAKKGLRASTCLAEALAWVWATYPYWRKDKNYCVYVHRVCNGFLAKEPPLSMKVFIEAIQDHLSIEGDTECVHVDLPELRTCLRDWPEIVYSYPYNDTDLCAKLRQQIADVENNENKAELASKLFLGMLGFLDFLWMNKRYRNVVWKKLQEFAEEPVMEEYSDAFVYLFEIAYPSNRSTLSQWGRAQ